MKKKTKKHVKTTIAAALAVGSVVAVAPMATQASTQFTDVKVNDYYYEDVLQLAERGVVNGFSDGTFKPKQDVTRGQAAKIIAGVLGLDTTNVSNPGFKDVTTSNQYYGAIAALANAGIINGFEDGTFRPGDAVQRNHMAKIIAGAFKLEAPADFKTPLKDVRADYAQYVTALYSAGVTTGKTATTFDGSSNVTRGQLASFVVRAENAGKITAPVAKDVTFTISQVDGSKVEGYTIPTALQGLLNEANNASLEGAIVRAKVLGDEIVGINTLQLNAPGTDGAFVILEGGNSTIAGDLIVNADYVEVKNVTVQGNVSLTSSVKSEFSADALINDGEIIVEDASSQVASVTPIFANTTNGPKIALKNSNVKKVHVKRDNVVLSSNVKLPEVTVSAKVSAIQVDADVAKLRVDVTVNIAISGAGSFDEVSLEKAVEVALAIVGKISKLVVYNTDAKVDLAASVKIGNVVLPANSTAKDIIKNYESIKGNIDNVVIGDKPTTPGSGGSGSSGGGSGSGDSGSSGGDSGSGGSNPEVEAPVTVTGVSAIIGDDGKGITVTASVANTTASTATIEFYEVDNGVVAPSPNYTRQADIKDGKVNFRTAELPAGTYQVKVKVGSVSAAASAFVTVLSGDQSTITVSEVNVVDGTDGTTAVETPVVGQVIRANITLSDGTVVGTYPEDPKASYKWYYEGTDTVIGTGSSYTVTSDNVGEKISVEVTYNGSTKTWTATEVVAPVAEVTVTEVNVVDGTDGTTAVETPAVGQVIRANITLSDGTVVGTYPEDPKASYKWYYEGTDTVIGTGSSYTVTSDNVGKKISVEVTYNGSTKTWTATEVVAPVAEVTVTEVNVVDGTDGTTVVETPAVGQVIRANITLSDGTVVGTYPEDPKASYKWYYEGTDTVIGTGSSYTVTSDNVGEKISVEVTYNGSTKTWTATEVVAPVAEVTVTEVNVVDGTDGTTVVETPVVGQVIRANITLSDGTVVGTYPEDPKASYKWYYEGTDTVIGTGSSYTVTSDNVGKKISVEVTYNGSTKTWTATDVVEPTEAQKTLTAYLEKAKAHDYGTAKNWLALDKLVVTETSVTADFNQTGVKEAIKGIYDKLVLDANGEVTGANGQKKEAVAYAIDSYIMNTFARYVGAFGHDTASPVKKVVFNGVEYTWQEKAGGGYLSGSNWKDTEGTSLVSVVVEQQETSIRDVSFKVVDGEENSINVTFQAIQVPTKKDMDAILNPVDEEAIAALTAYLEKAKAHDYGTAKNWLALDKLVVTETSVTADFNQTGVKEAIKGIYDKLVLDANGEVTGANGQKKEAVAYAIDSYIMNTFARYVGAFGHDTASPIKKVVFNGVEYTWQEKAGGGYLSGSNWKDTEGTSLVSVVVEQQETSIRDVSFKVVDGEGNSIDVTFQANPVPTKADIEDILNSVDEGSVATTLSMGENFVIQNGFVKFI